MGPPDYPVADNEARHKLYWRIQRVGWVCMMLALVAAVLGTAGSGRLDRAEAKGHGIRVKYSRFPRMSAPTALEIVLDPSGRAESASLWVSRKYLGAFELSGVTPQPVSAQSTGERLTQAFSVVPGEPLHVDVRLSVEEGSVGFVTAHVGTTAGQVEFWQFIWP